MSVRDTYVNEALTMVCAEATVSVVTPVVNTVLRFADCFTVNDAGRAAEQENHFEPCAVTYPQKYLDFPKQYFEALASSDENTLKNLLAVAPGSFPDPEQMSPEAFQQRDAAAAKTVPLGRVGRLKEVGYLAVFLASPAEAYVTGQTWAVDGGVSIKTA